MMKKIVIFILLMLEGMTVSAQLMQVKSFVRLPMDLTARIQPRIDLNGNYCAVIRVLSVEKDLQFSGNIIGDLEYKDGEILLYLVSGSKNITIIDKNAGMLCYKFPEKLEEQSVYELNLRFVENKRERLRSIVTVGFDFLAVQGGGGREINDVSYNIMIGLVRKFGGYARLRTTFYWASPKASIASDDPSIQSYDIPVIERFAVLGGGIIRLSSSIYIMAGIGYGYVNAIADVCTQDNMENAEVMKLTNYSSSGIEMEIGGILRIMNIALSINAQTNQFEYYAFGFGLGFMF
jgi:hypothetical protein